MNEIRLTLSFYTECVTQKGIDTHIPKQGQSATGAFFAIDYGAESQQDGGEKTAVSVAEYREMLLDDVSTDEQIIKRLQYLGALCRNVIKSELQTYASKNKKGNLK